MSSETGRPERASSIASSSTEAGTFDENEKLAKIDHSEDGLKSLKPPEELEMAEDGEDAGLLPPADEKPEPPKNTFMSSLIWMVINTLATIGIVSASVS